MSVTPAMIDAMLAAGLTREQMAELIKADLLAEEAAEEARLEAKRAKNAERQRRFKAKRKAEQEENQTQGNADNALPPLPTVTDVTSGSPPPDGPLPLPHTPTLTPLNPPTTPRTTGGAREQSGSVVEMKARPPPNRATRLPADFEPSPEDIAVARQEGLTDEQIRREIDRFRDYFAGAPGERGLRTNWHSTLRNWFRKAAESVGGARRTASGGHGTSSDGWLGAAVRVAARYRNANDHSE